MQSLLIKKEHIDKFNKLVNDYVKKHNLQNGFVVNIDATTYTSEKCKLNIYHNEKLIDSFEMPSKCFTDTLHYKITPEQWLYKKGYMTKGTAYHKNTPKKGASKAFYDLFAEIHNGNLLYFENLINEIKKIKKKNDI